MEHKVQEEVADYLSGLRLANSEEAKKLRFQNLLTRLFQDSQEAIDALKRLVVQFDLSLRSALRLTQAGPGSRSWRLFVF